MQEHVSAIKNFVRRSATTAAATVVSGTVSVAVVLVVVFAVSALSTSCRKTPPPVRVESVAVSPAEMTLLPGESDQATARVEPADADDKSVVWSSDDSSVATVSSTGLVKAVAPGATAIRVTANDGGKTTRLNVTVRDPRVRVTSVALDKSTSIMTVGDSDRLAATVEPEDATDKTVSWSSSDERIATVSEGLVTAHAPGRVTITATTADGGKTAECTVAVYSADPPVDGKVTVLQQATEGAGIDIVLMGDGFSDKTISDGTYAAAMKDAAEHFFSEEPYLSHRRMFNVWAVDVISGGSVFDGSTALGCTLASGGVTTIEGNDSRCMEYAYKAVGDFDRMDNTVIVVMVNSPTWHGTCYMYYPAGYPNVAPGNDCGEGLSVSYFAAGRNTNELRQLLVHESNGHGFPKLGDEYWYDNDSSPTNEEIATLIRYKAWGWAKNIDLTSDPAEVKWAAFLADPRYAREGLGVYEGGYYNGRGVWRSTEESIMRYNRGGFNAPSREAIYYRIHRLAFGAEWRYDYETFVRWDLARAGTSVSAAGAAADTAAGTAARSVSRTNGDSGGFGSVEGSEGSGDVGAEDEAGMGVLSPMPHTPPVVVPRSWRDAFGK